MNMSKQTYENFELKKFKVVNKKGHLTWYNLGDSSLELQEADLKSVLHDDLKDAVKVLQKLMAKRLGLLSVTDALIKDFPNNKKVMEFALAQEQKQVDRCNVTGITYSGSEDKLCVQITGSMEGDEYGSVGLATPITRLKDEVLGYEKEIVEACEVVKKEVFEHAFKNKKAPDPKDNQTDLEDAIADAEKEKQGE